MPSVDELLIVFGLILMGIAIALQAIKNSRRPK